MMFRRLAPALVAIATLAACSPAPASSATPTPTPSVSASPSPSPTPSPSPSPSPTPSPWGSDRLPFTYRIVGSLLDNAPAVVAALHRAAAHLPVLKLDITETQATLTALAPDDSVVSYRWSEDAITAVDSDFQYLGQATFDPATFPLDSVERMFAIAELHDVTGDLVLQILDYRDGLVLMTVTSRPETGTVFFNRDGSTVNEIGTITAADLEAGIAAVVQNAMRVYSLSISPDGGYRADLPAPDGQILTRTRMGAMPAFETLRTETTPLKLFDPRLVDPVLLAELIDRYRTSAQEACEIAVDTSLERPEPAIRLRCAEETRYVELDGTDITATVD